MHLLGVNLVHDGLEHHEFLAVVAHFDLRHFVGQVNRERFFKKVWSEPSPRFTLIRLTVLVVTARHSRLSLEDCGLVCN